MPFASEMVFDYSAEQRAPLKGVAQPLRFNGERQAQRLPPPMSGEHTLEPLRETGYSEAEVAKLMTDGIVRAASNRAT